MYDTNVSYYLSQIYEEMRVANKLKAIELLGEQFAHEEELKEIIDKR